MNVHKNARLTPHSRGELVRRVLVVGQTPRAVATALGVSGKTVRKWVGRFQAEGEAGLQDRSSRPSRLRRPSTQELRDRSEALRRQRWNGQPIAKEHGLSPATVRREMRVLLSEQERSVGKEGVSRWRARGAPEAY